MTGQRTVNMVKTSRGWLPETSETAQRERTEREERDAQWIAQRDALLATDEQLISQLRAEVEKLKQYNEWGESCAQSLKTAKTAPGQIDATTIRTGALLTVRRDLEDAQSHVSGAWAADTDARLTAVVYGLEALLRATSTLTLIVEREQQS